MRRLWLLLLVLAPAGFAFAAPVTLTEGVEYQRLAAPEPAANAATIEVLEVFSYGCVHCFHLLPALEEWKRTQPADVELHYLPATFRPEFTLYARGFYAAQSLGQLEATHARVFEAIWNERLAIRSLADLASLYARLGLDRTRFVAAAQSADNRAAVDAAHQQMQRLQIDGTPAFIVDGRYRVLDDLIGSSEELLQRVAAVVAMARAERGRRH
ncbi:MAG: thiol:disulfide interchange protein DsbA/DsbL [Gammaproteobacteria bacterium]|nr:thiol:disulfide interchange protein DsbA/DsbL [Gammaproteobacteria bacterium]